MCLLFKNFGPSGLAGERFLGGSVPEVQKESNSFNVDQAKNGE